MRKYYVYVHTNKADGKKYYGMTLQKPHRRWGKDGNNYTNQAFREAIERHGWDGFEHEVLASGLPFKEASRLEQTLISRDETTNPAKGYNKIPATHPAREQCYKNISAAITGHPVSQSTREKIRRAVRKAPVVKLSPEGQVLERFPSLTEAAKSVNLHKSNICAACNGRKHTARGFVWRYAANSSASSNAKKEEVKQ